MKTPLLITTAILFCVTPLQAALLAHWGFDSQDMNPTSGSGTMAAQGGAVVSWTTGTVDNDPRGGGAVAGNALELASPFNGFVVILVDGTGLEDFVLSYAGKNISGNTAVNWAWSTDGGIFTALETDTLILNTWSVETVDFSSVSALDGQPNVFFRGTLGTFNAATDDFDNFQVTATAVPELTHVALCLFGVIWLGIGSGRWVFSKSRNT